ncbi:MAG TPA: BTAD domain-containing putative transcriptional regulator [Acidothermaceae bacterium]|nr:BTAD domain-containing putative transcriptional regulator [Acidothermaceae bacterium]
MTLASALPTRIQLCGPTVVELAGQRVEGTLPGRQGRVLFAYLVLNRHRLASRDELTSALWPGSLPAGSETAFNALLSKLRKAIAPSIIDGRSSLRLQLDDEAWVDIEVAEAAAHKAESRIVLGDCKSAWGASLAALFIAEREFLPGEDAPWISDQRARLAQVRRRALEAYAAAALGTGGTELPAAVRAGRQLVRLDPLRETGYQILMQALAAQGNSAEALRIYADLCEVLRDELGVSPSAPIEAVYQSLLR